MTRPYGILVRAATNPLRVNTLDKNQHLEVQLVATIEARLVEGALSHRRRFDLDHHLGKCQAADPEESRRRPALRFRKTSA